jgi:hypothetical protein
MNVSDDRLALWARPLSETEDAKCVSAREQITQAMRAKFGNSVRVFLQGSYANRTNVRQDSDIDIVVVHTDFYFPDVSLLPQEQQSTYWASFKPATYTYDDFRNEVHTTLLSTFPSMVQPKEKCLKVAGNTTRMNADVIASFTHHRFYSPTDIEHTGIAFNTRSGTRVESFPEQHYDNGVVKNESTGRSYKQIVRILKNVRNALIESRSIDEKLVSSFFIECLVWNVPDEYFEGTSNREIARAVVAKILHDMRDPNISKNYLEISKLFWLFRGQPRTTAQAEAFMLKAWHYLEP